MSDTRDQKTYTIAKLPDGNCWMTQNLRLGNSNEHYTLTLNDSDVESDFILPEAQTTTTGSWGDATNSNKEKHVFASENTDYGNLYNWYTATAGTGTSDLASQSVTSLTNAKASICPNGWRLPDGGQSRDKSYYQLDLAIGGAGTNRANDTTFLGKYHDAPFLFTYSGYYQYNTGLGGQDKDGRWWTRSASLSSGRGAYYFRLYSVDAFVNPYDHYYVGSGYAIRCVNK